MTTTPPSARRQKRLPSDVEADLARRAFEGDVAARDELLANVEWLIYNIVRGYGARGRLDEDDLLQAARCAAVEAIDSYNPVGPHPCALIYWRCRRALRIAVKRAYGLPEGADYNHRLRTLSLSLPVSRNADDDRTLQDILSDRDAATPEELAGDGLASERLRQALATLPPRERTAITQRFLHDGELRDIGSSLGVSHQGARLLIEKGLHRLRGELVAPAPA